MRTKGAKVGVYAHWGSSDTKIQAGYETEYYDYGTQDGVAEMTSTPDDPAAQQMRDYLLNTAIPNELRAPLPGPLDVVQKLAEAEYIAFARVLQNLPASGFSTTDLRDVLGFGAEF
jgi:hypothetical protein